MPKMSVYLPDDLYEVVKSEGWSISEILQGAIHDRMSLADKMRVLDELIALTFAEVGEPTPEDIQAAEESVQRMKTHARQRRKRRERMDKNSDQDVA